MAKKALIIGLALILWMPFDHIVDAEDTDKVLTVYYFHRSPYYITQDDGNATGFLVEITRMILDHADISYVFVDFPPKRILKNIKRTEYSCSIGWFKNVERETFARFSDPIYQDMPTGIVLRHSSLSLLGKKPALRELMQSGLMLGVVDGFSYGARIDEAIAQLKPSIYAISGESENLLKMIQSERIDYAFMVPEEFRYMLKRDPLITSDLRLIEIADEIEGNNRFLMFSSGVGPEIIERVNESIKIVKQTDKYADLITLEVP
jgi:polar amino acid transport system substrate-binding protein